MAREKRLVPGDVLDTYDAVRLHLDDAIDQQERVAMRQDALYFVDIQDGHESRYYSNRGFDPFAYESAGSRHGGVDPAVRRMRIAKRRRGGGQPFRRVGV